MSDRQTAAAFDPNAGVTMHHDQQDCSTSMPEQVLTVMAEPRCLPIQWGKTLAALASAAALVSAAVAMSAALPKVDCRGEGHYWPARVVGLAGRRL
eukprot:1373973-Amphidinium_carterae.1